MTLDHVFSQLPEPQSHTFPDYSIPKGDPVIPVALTSTELSTLLELYKTFTAVDPTGLDSNPFLEATSTFLQQTFGMPSSRPDQQLHDDIAALLNDFSDDLGGHSLGVVDATPKHHQTLYFFLTTCKGYSLAPHIQFNPDSEAIETLYEIYERVTEQDTYLKRPETVLE